jgi:hypothetical protein
VEVEAKAKAKVKIKVKVNRELPTDFTAYTTAHTMNEQPATDNQEPVPSGQFPVCGVRGTKNSDPGTAPRGPHHAVHYNELESIVANRSDRSPTHGVRQEAGTRNLKLGTRNLEP